MPKTNHVPSPVLQSRSPWCSKQTFAAMVVFLLSVSLYGHVVRAAAGGSDRTVRTPAEIDALINKAGHAPADWWRSVPLEYPKTLDLSWPDKPPGPWNARENVGQYMWSIINENPGRWRSGTRFMHYMIGLHRDNPRVLAKAIGQLAHCYQDLLRDWPRAAFWRRKQIERDPRNLNARIQLAECYWKLGSKPMAVAQLNTVSRYLSPMIIKLWSDMGEFDKALAIAEGLVRWYPWMGYLAAGNTCRRHGRYDQAVDYYRKTLRVPATGRYAKRIEQYHIRARANVQAVRQFDALDLARVGDGSHTGTGTAYAGPLEVVVVVKGGRIVSVKVTRHQDKQYFGAIAETPRMIVRQQGVKGVDAVSGATITSEAIINAAAKALAGATK